MMKLTKQKITNNNTDIQTDYIGNFIYENNLLKYILTDYGKININITGNDTLLTRQYNLTDHLGNIRVTFDQTGNILQEDSYYPFGMTMNGLSYLNETVDPDNKNNYLFNNKELQEDFGLDWYSFDARMYDAQLGRWHVQDNYSEKYYSLSNYNYCMNNPIAFVDPTGDTTYYYANDGTYLGVTFDKLDNGVTVVNDLKGWSRGIFDHAMAVANGQSTEGAEITTDNYAKSQRGFGDTYMVNDMWSFNDTYGHDEKAGTGYKDGKEVKLSNEYGTYTYIDQNGEIRTGKEAFEGGLGLVSYGVENKGGKGSKVSGGKYAARAHIHTDVGVHVTMLGEGQAYPSGTDWNSVSNNGKYFRAVISQKEIWLYNKVNHQKVEIRVSRAPFKHLDPKKK